MRKINALEFASLDGVILAEDISDNVGIGIGIEGTGRKPVSSCLAKGNRRVHFRRAPGWKVAG
jgi:hypothetical protein